MLNVPAPRDPALALHVKDFGFGLNTRDAPLGPPGAAIVSENCDYFGRSLNNRRGYAAVLENGPGAVKISNFEPAEVWAGGVAYSTEFVTIEAEANGTQGIRLAIVAPAPGTTSRSPLVLNLGTDPLDLLHVWLKVSARDATVTGAALKLRLETDGANYYEATIAADADPDNDLVLNNPKYARIRRQEFTKTGAPTWTNITKISFILSAGGTGAMSVVVDNLHRTPGLMQALFQFRRESGDYQGARTEYAITGGVLYRNDGKRWSQVFAGFDTSRPVHHVVAQDRVILSDGVTSPRVLMSDGTTVYRLGIVTPPRTVTAIGLSGGHLSDGAYFVMVLWYSSKTGAFSAPDDAVPATATVTIAGGGGVASIRFSNLPVSADPQVDWVRIGIRPDGAEKMLFFPASDGAFGEVANGTTTYDFTGSVSELLARAAAALDTDGGYPTVVDPVTKLPVEAHPTMLVEAGGYILTTMSEQPTVLRFSRFRDPSGWAIDDEVPVGENDNEPISGMGRIGSSVMVGKRTAVYWARVVGGEEKVLVDGPVSERGPLEHKGIVELADTLWYRSQEGLCLVGLNQVPLLITAPQVDTWDELWDPHGFGLGAAVRVRGREQVVHFGRRLGALWNDTGWCTHHRSFRTVQRLRDAEFAASLWTIPADVASEVRTAQGFQAWIGGAGQVWQMNYGSTDDRRPFVTRHRTHLWSKDPQFVWTWSDLDVESTVSGAFSLTVRPFVGPAVVKDSESILSLKGESDPLGEFVLGTSRLGAALYCHNKMRLPRIVGRYLGLEFEFRAAGELRIQRVTAYCQPTGRQRGRTA